MAVIAGNGQTAIDIALQECGAIEAVVGICLTNDITIYDAIGAGVKVETVAVIDINVVQQFMIEKRKPASFHGNIVEDYDGIDYWIIEDDFIIS